MNQYQITSRPRHLRSVFFIENDYSHFFELVNLNLKMWGGRYNPIVPVLDNKIPDRYIELLRYYDPDYVYYSGNIDIDIVKGLRIFNPAEYIHIDPKRSFGEILGFNALHLISRNENDLKILLPNKLWGHESPLLDFYLINFGLDRLVTWGDSDITKGISKIEITGENYSSLNQILFEEKPINRTKLSKKNLNTVILRNLEKTKYNSFEIVIARDKLSVNDLSYYWNRHLFECSNILFCTLDELNILIEDEYFHYLISRIRPDVPIELVSMSLQKEEILRLIKEKLEPISQEHRYIFNNYVYKEVDLFPFVVQDARGLFERDFGENLSTQALISEKGLYHIPSLSFTDKAENFPQKWCIDIDIKSMEENYLNRIQVPLTTDSSMFFPRVDSRINKRKSFTVFIHTQNNQSDSFNIIIPSFFNLTRQLIQRPKLQGDFKQSNYSYVDYHDDSYKLLSFIQLFNQNLLEIEDYLTDKFWVDTFEKLCLSNKSAGDSITFEGLFNSCISVIEKNGIEFGKKKETNINKENLEIGLKRTLSYLNQLKIFLKGYVLKCTNCSSIFWYHISDVGETVNCKGCLQEYNVPVESKIAYKLNDLIRNNIYQSKDLRDGNLTVIRALVSLSRRSRQSFFYGPQVNLFTDFDSSKPEGDIDIFCLIDGELVIGEAKHSSKAFFDKSSKALKSLVEIAKEIFPDQIILACYENNNGKLEKAKKSLIRYFKHWEYMPRIEIIDLEAPDYFDLEGFKYFYY